MTNKKPKFKIKFEDGLPTRKEVIKAFKGLQCLLLGDCISDEVLEQAFPLEIPGKYIADKLQANND